MMEAPTVPLTKPECDLRDFAFMPLDVVRLFGSRFHAISNDSEWRAGVTLWLKSFHQVPAASLPNDDIELCRLAELGRDMKTWRKVKEVALHGWILCSDGRLYHPVVSEKANEAWSRKLAQRERSRKGNEKRWGVTDNHGDESTILKGSRKEQEDHHKNEQTDSKKESLRDSQKESSKDPKGQGQGQGQWTLTPKPVSDANASSGETAAQSPPESPETQPEKTEPFALFPVAHSMACPVEKLVGLYHELMPRNPRCRVLNQTRRKAIAARWKEAAYLNTFPFKGGYDTQAKGLACWREFFAICSDSDFLTGKTQPSQGRPPFLADLDFLMSPSAFAKTLENKYHREVA